jgi:hypothetical protein
MTDQTLAPYIRLIRQFLGRSIDAAAFERAYLQMFKHQQAELPNHSFKILDKLFADVDAFCPDPELRDLNDLDEVQLREKCLGALNRLGEE